ncbi:MAG TPA: thiol reductant ABC exporter subunit CydC [Mycobacterium sp.]|nr:thiol reductant ABC exporter subunit CydC [Mycobacterium sp.]
MPTFDRLTSDPLWAAIGLLRPRAPRLLLAILCGVLSLGSALALAAVSAWLITRAWQMPPVLDLSIAVVAVRAFGISRGVLHYCERLVSHDTALRAAGNARVEIYRRLSVAPDGSVARLSGGQLAGRFGADVDALAEVLVRAVLPMAVAFVLSVAAVTVIAVISPATAVVLAGALLVAGALAPWLAAGGARAAEEAARTQHAGRDTAAMLALDHAPELRVSGRLAAVIAESQQRQRDWGHAVDRAARPAALGAAAPTAAMGLSVLAAAIAGIGLATTMAPTTVAILMLLPLSAFEATTALPAAALALTRARIAARRLLELGPGGAPATHGLAHPPHTTTLRAESLQTGHDHGATLGPLSLDLPAGSRLALTGTSGAGKTTLLMTLAGLLPALGGRVTLGGVALTDLGEPQLRAAMVYFPEDAHVFDTTVRDNLLVVRGDCTDTEIATALQRTGLQPWLRELPDGLSTVLNGGAAALSGGQRRRLLLARALLSRARIVLLDEPTEHLDTSAGAALLRAILTPGELFGPDQTVLVATHHLPSELSCPQLHIGSAEYPGCQSSIRRPDTLRPDLESTS